MKWRMEKPALNANVRWQWQFWIDNYGVREGWRGRIAYFMRWLASRLDGRTACIVCMRTEPPLDQDIKLRILSDGFKHMHTQLELATKEEAVGQVIEQALPQGASDEKANR